MKKILLSLTFGLATTVVFGQIEAGTKILGGEFNYNSSSNETTIGNTTTDGPKNSNITVVPSFGYMFQDNIGAGIRIGINNSTTETTDQNGDVTEDKDNLTIVGLFGRYYIDVAGDQLYFHTDLILDFGFGSNEVTQGNTTVTTDLNTMLIGLRPGWDYFIGDKWAVELNWGFLGYESRTWSAEDYEDKTTGFGLNFDFTSISMGARWYF